MKNVNVLLAVVLCAGLCVLFGLFNRSADESLGWSPNDMYMQSISSGEGASFTSANLSGSNVSNDGVAVSMRNGSFSLRTRARHTSSPYSLIANGVPEKSVDFLGALSPNSPASSPNSLIGHMTSSAEFHSFGGGSNMAMGSYTSSPYSLIASSPAIGSYSPSPISPIALLPNASEVGFNNLPSLQGGAGGRPVVSAEQALISTSSSASGLFGSAMSSYGSATYDQVIYGAYGSTPNGIRGRQNAGPGSSAYDSWLEWLRKYGASYGTSGEGENSWEFDNEGAYNAFLAWFRYTYGQDYDPENPSGGMSVPAITYEQWLTWFTSHGGTHTYGDYTFKFTPIGNILPLILMALMYMIILFVKRNKTAQL